MAEVHDGKIMQKKMAYFYRRFRVKETVSFRNHFRRKAIPLRWHASLCTVNIEIDCFGWRLQMSMFACDTSSVTV